MQVDSTFVADIRELVSSNDLSQIAELSPCDLSIGAVVELTCLRSASPGPLRTLLDNWAQASPILSNAFQTYDGGTLPSTENMWASRQLDFFPIRGQNWAEERHYHPFESRFRKTAKEAGFGDKADGLTGALFEMADNVAQHSGKDSSCPAHGLIGYYICDGHAAFAIGDLGRGVLASLKENPTWATLPNSKEALVAVIKNHASRRAYGGEGEGFKEMLRSLTNLNGIVELCSNEPVVLYTFLDSTLSPTAIVNLARQHGLAAIALTDLGNLHGAVEFTQAAKQAGIKPIFGTELRVGEHPLLLYVESARGYHNLNRLLSRRAEAEGEDGAVAAQERRSIPFEHLDGLTDGLIAAGTDGRLAGLFPGRFYEIAAKRTAEGRFPVVACPAMHHATPDDRLKYDIVQSIRTLTLLRQEQPTGNFVVSPGACLFRSYTRLKLTGGKVLDVRESTDQIDRLVRAAAFQANSALQ